MAKLTREQKSTMKMLRKEGGMTLNQIAKRFKVSPTSVYYVVGRRGRRHGTQYPAVNYDLLKGDVRASRLNLHKLSLDIGYNAWTLRSLISHRRGMSQGMLEKIARRIGVRSYKEYLKKRQHLYNGNGNYNPNGLLGYPEYAAFKNRVFKEAVKEVREAIEQTLQRLQ